MTHDELQMIVDKMLHLSGAARALYEVVKLHKLDETNMLCTECSGTQAVYPCKTIQVIKGELL